MSLEFEEIKITLGENNKIKKVRELIITFKYKLKLTWEI
jgi:hypothetical protein